jgi:hypothetical protein
MELDDDEYDPTPKLRPIPRPRRCFYDFPQSDELPEIVKKLLERSNTPVNGYTFKPIHNIEGYIRSAGFTGEKADEIRKLHYLEPEPPKETKEKFNVPRDPLHVFANLKVLKNGTVKVKLSVPMEPVYEYQKKAKMAPLAVRIIAAKGFGYPDHILEKMIAHDDYMKKTSKEREKFLDDIFGKHALTKPSKPKAKSNYETLTSIFKKKPKATIY